MSNSNSFRARGCNLLFFIILLFVTSFLYAQLSDNGQLKGRVIDRETQKQLKDALVNIVELNRISATDSNGYFEFNKIPYGTYRLEISILGYEAVVKTDIIVLSSRPTEVLVELNPKSYTIPEINVEAKYFEKPLDISSSIYNLDFEEIRRAPGAVEDISRMVQVLPGVAPGNDQRNDLIVRGGSPSENLILIDGVEIPNINHFPSQGSTSGPIGMINDKFISDVNFTTGGFPARFGDHLSSVMDIKFREGQRNRFLSDINLSSAGFGGVFEGPLFSKKGSFLFSARRSYLNLIRGAIRLAAVPNFWDFNFKSVYDLDQKNSLTLLGVAGIDDIKFEGSESEISDDNPFGRAEGRQRQFAGGFVWKSLFKNAYLQTIFSNSIGDNHITNRDLIR